MTDVVIEECADEFYFGHDERPFICQLSKDHTDWHSWSRDQKYGLRAAQVRWSNEEKSDMNVDNIAIEECVVDQTVLLECFDADEHGVFTYWVCKAGEHTYRSGNDGYGPYPIDQGDYDDDR